MNDLRVASEFWKEWEECGANAAEMSRRHDIPRSTIKEWKQHHKAGHLYVNGGWMTAKQAAEEEEDASLRELLDYLKTRTTPVGPPTKAKASRGNYAVELIGCDIQYPFVHEAAFEVFLGLAERMQPDGITLNGDTYDFPYLSRFRQNPLIRQDMQADIDECRMLLARINSAAPDALKRITVGNHDLDRLERYLMEKAPALMHLRMFQMFDQLLGLEEVGWELVKEGYWLIEKVLRVAHGTAVTNTQGGGSAQSAKKEMLKWGCAGVTGHTHKLGSFYRKDGIGYRQWHEGGCLCDQKKMREARVTVHTDYDACEDWHLGCVRVDYNPDGESYTITDIPILESDSGRVFAIWNDEEITA